MKKIPLTGINKVTRKREVTEYTMVDDEDFEWLSKYKWSLKGSGHVNAKPPKSKTIMMHVIIMEKYFGKLPDGMVNDHKNNVKTDNQKHNLRRCTYQENSLNRIRHAKNETSTYKGVNYRSDSGKYRVRIMVNGRQISLGQYATEIEAAIVYNRAAKKYHGDFAYLNVIPEEYRNVIPKNLVRVSKKVAV